MLTDNDRSIDSVTDRFIFLSAVHKVVKPPATRRSFEATAVYTPHSCSNRVSADRTTYQKSCR